MENFIDMNINDLLQLQQELKRINDCKGKLKQDDVELFQENINFFRDISEDINYKFDELYQDD